MTQLITLKSHFASLAKSQGFISDADYHAACHGISDDVILTKLADWLVAKKYKLVKGIGPQYQKEVLEKVKNPNVENIKDTKYRTHKNKDKVQKSKKKKEAETQNIIPMFKLTDKQRSLLEFLNGNPEYGNENFDAILSGKYVSLDDIDIADLVLYDLLDTQMLDSEESNIASALHNQFDMLYNQYRDYHREMYPQNKWSSHYLNKTIEDMQKFENEFFSAQKKWQATLHANKEFLAMLASVGLTAQDFSTPEQGQRSVEQLLDSYGNDVPEDAYIPNDTLQAEFSKVDPNVKLPILQRITTAISKIFDTGTLSDIFSDLYKGIQSGFEHVPIPPQENVNPQEKLPSGTRTFEETPGPSGLETASMKLKAAKKISKVSSTVARIGYVNADRMRVKFANGNIISAYVAATPMQKATGLEVFDSLDIADGLLFPFDEEGSATFHMGSVQFPIDIVFLMESPHGLEVGKIVSNIQPGVPDWWSYPKTSAVLELAGNACKKLNIKVGSLCSVSKRIEAQMEPSEEDLLRDVDIDGYHLKMWDTNKTGQYGKSILGYEFFDRDGKLLFTGEDFSPSPMDAIDSDDAVRTLLSFLTLRPGDTDDEYFADYTPEQMEFAETEAENLQLYSMEDEEDYPAMEFQDWEDKEDSSAGEEV